MKVSSAETTVPIIKIHKQARLVPIASIHEHG
jgi:hypothetical protein